MIADYLVGNGNGTAYYNHAVWNTVHDAITGTDATLTDLWISTYLDGNYYIYRTFLPIDTSAIPDGATIISAVLYVYIDTVYVEHTSGEDIALVQTTQPSTSTLAAEDFDLCGAVDSPTEGASRTAVTSTGWHTWTLNATGRGWISDTGITKLGLRAGLDADDTSPDTLMCHVHADTDSDTFPPYLKVSYVSEDEETITEVFNIVEPTVVRQVTLYQVITESITLVGTAFSKVILTFTETITLRGIMSFISTAWDKLAKKTTSWTNTSRSSTAHTEQSKNTTIWSNIKKTIFK